MTTLDEKNIQITFPDHVRARKFDDNSHGLSHCMKAVDFIVELNDRYIFIEFKDPQHPRAKDRDKEKFVNNLKSDHLDKILAIKYRDTFVYEWAAQRVSVDKPIHYYVLIALDNLTDADLLVRTDSLRRMIPLQGPVGIWKRQIIASCAVFNFTSWNKYLQDYPIRRISEPCADA